MANYKQGACFFESVFYNGVANFRELLTFDLSVNLCFTIKLLKGNVNVII